MPKIFKVGGCVRDRLLGVETKDIDFTFVLDNLDRTVEEGFKEMEQWMIDQGFTIFLSVPEMFTIRAKFPSDHKFAKLDADFVMARKEIGYEEGTRRPILELGTLEDDLVRRDFTVNAMAEDEDGDIIDLFDGMVDLKNKVLKTPLPFEITFHDDPLRILRAIRFSITKGFTVPIDMEEFIRNYDYEVFMAPVVSAERVREELFKCFKHDTHATIVKLTEFPYLMDYVFRTKIWLKPTFEK
jgi:tRNA nucleotidyltransferase/poly(A) polymerase